MSEQMNQKLEEETLRLLRQYHGLKGQTQREMFVEQLRDEDANILHKILQFATKQVITDRDNIRENDGFASNSKEDG